MTTYIIKRLLLMIPTLLGITIIVFCLVRFAPGDPLALQSAGEGGTVQVDPKLRDSLKAARQRMYGLDQPIPVQYYHWMGKIVRGDLGESITEHRPVIDMIKERLPLTFKLNVSSEILFYLLSIPLGLMAARNRYASPIRRAIFDTSSGVVLLILYSMPGIFLGTLLIAWFSRGGWLEGWLIANHHEGWSWLVMPIGGVTSEQVAQMGYWAYLRDVCWHFILPVVTMTVGGLAFMSKLARASLLENLRMDYVRTAYAKGLKERVVVYVHALRNSLLPMITILAGILPAMIGGSLIIEYIFNLPGMGMLYWTAVTRRDYDMIQAEALIGAGLTLVAILICDIMYAVVDPRVRYD